MKTLLFIMVCLFLTCKAQVPIIDLRSKNLPDNLNDIYLKDVNNILDKFEGTWLYQNGSTSLKIQLIKKEMIFGGRWYSDRLLGEYQYIENDLEVVNYLPKLLDPNVNDQQHTIDGNKLVSPYRPPACNECSENDYRVILKFTDRERIYIDSEILVQHFIQNGIEKIRIRLNVAETSIIPEGGALQSRVPYGEYVLTKIE